MTPDLAQEFQSLSEKSKRHLEDVPESEGYRHLFSFWTFPSFSPPSRCTLYSAYEPKEQKAFASFTDWRSDLDLEKLRSPVERLKYPKDLDPTIEEDVVRLSEDEVNNIEQRIHGISIPLHLGQPSVGGFDGTRFKFQYDELFFGASIHWWEDYPSEWRPFTSAIMQIITELEARRKKKAS